AELVMASWIELENAPPSSTPAVERAASPEMKEATRAVVRAKRASVPPWRTTTIVLGTTIWSRAAATIGGGLRLLADGPSTLGFGIDLVGEHGSAETALGRVAIDALRATIAVHLSRRWTHRALYLRAGARGGTTKLSGEPDAGADGA